MLLLMCVDEVLLQGWVGAAVAPRVSVVVSPCPVVVTGVVIAAAAVVAVVVVDVLLEWLFVELCLWFVCQIARRRRHIYLFLFYLFFCYVILLFNFIYINTQTFVFNSKNFYNKIFFFFVYKIYLTPLMIFFCFSGFKHYS